ncbi:MAG TPA: chemotaxis protein CheW [Anaeromyxobacter sp.]
MDHGPGAGAPGRTSADAVREREDLVAIRSGGWRFLVPLRHVERILPAAMPAARPAAPAVAPVLALGEALVPVVFASALLGAAEVTLSAGQQMVLLADGGRRAVLWVDAVEDVVAHAAAQPAPGATARDLVAGWSGPERPLAVLDIPRLLTLATGEPPRREA